MASTATTQLLSTSFLAHTFTTTPERSFNQSRGAASCKVVTCSATGGSSKVRQALKLAVVLPIAACTLLAASPHLPYAEAGVLSGASGMESVELPSIPEPNFLTKIKDGKRKMYENQDETFKTSSYLQELLKKSKDNAALHKKEIADKYCERGAEWGVGDCSLMGMNQAQREEFMRVLKQK